MISIDTLRRDRLGRYDGSDRTPFMDRLLNEGVALDDHRSCSNWTYASALCGLSGRNDTALGLALEADSLSRDPLPEDVELLGDWLQDAGFATALVSSNFFVSEHYSLDRSYDTIRSDPDWTADRVSSEALAVFDGQLADLDGRWFLHLHYLDPHMPYDPPPPYLGGLDALPETSFDFSTKKGTSAMDEARSELSDEELEIADSHLRVRYDAEIAWLDDQLAKLWGQLKSRGALENTLVVIWSDHGEQFYDHGELAHRKGLYNEETAALGLFWSPRLQARALRQPTTHRDLAPTLLDALGLPPRAELDGIPAGTSEGCPRYASSVKGEGTLQSVDLDGMRLIYDWRGTLALYDLDADPLEQDDLSSEQDVSALWALLEPQVEALRWIYLDAEPVPPAL